jgi:hypothetical protein
MLAGSRIGEIGRWEIDGAVSLLDDEAVDSAPG